MSTGRKGSRQSGAGGRQSGIGSSESRRDRTQSAVGRRDEDKRVGTALQDAELIAKGIEHVWSRMPDLVINPRRPNRVEPRQVKRRPKSYSLLTKPRDELRKALLKSSDMA